MVVGGDTGGGGAVGVNVMFAVIGGDIGEGGDFDDGGRCVWWSGWAAGGVRGDWPGASGSASAAAAGWRKAPARLQLQGGTTVNDPEQQQVHKLQTSAASVCSWAARGLKLGSQESHPSQPSARGTADYLTM